MTCGKPLSGPDLPPAELTDAAAVASEADAQAEISGNAAVVTSGDDKATADPVEMLDVVGMPDVDPKK